MKTKELIKKAGILEIEKIHVDNVGLYLAINIALVNKVATRNYQRIASRIVCERASKFIYKNKKYAIK